MPAIPDTVSNTESGSNREFDTLAGAFAPIPVQDDRRPSRAVGVLLDGALAAAAYFGSYWLRFPSERLAIFLPHMWSTLPVVVCTQLVSLTALRSYSPRAGWFFRAGCATALGTALAVI